MAGGKAKVELDLSALLELRDHPEQVLRDLDMPCRDEVRRTLDISLFLVPVGDPSDESNLRETGFISGPVYNMGPLSTTWFSGYEHPHAAEIHAGWHFGRQTEKPPPEWLRKSFKGARGRVRKAVARQVMVSLARICGTHKA